MTKKPKLSEIVESAQRIVDNLGIGGDYLGQEKDAIKDITQEIERLLQTSLAGERDRGADAIVELTKKYDALLAAERERVREMCAVKCDELDGWRDWEKVQGFEGAPTEAAAAAGYLADRIRQLDLTVPSSTEEGKGRKEHIAWCKNRAKEYVEIGDFPNAVWGMLSDLSLHPEAKDYKASKRVLGAATLEKNEREGVLNFIEGFN